MRWIQGLRRPGVPAVLGGAFLFGISTPLAKLLLYHMSAGLLAGLLYLGSGVGLAFYRRAARARPVQLSRSQWRWLLGAVVAGGVIGPLLLMTGLTRLPAANASLLLNAETVFTALLAWFVFHENTGRRVILGLTAIVAGAVLLGAPVETASTGMWPALAVVGACLAWGIDNNVTRKIALVDATWLASVKGLAAGTVNLAAALGAGARLPAWPVVAGALLVGLVAYGVSFALFVVGLRHLGAARAGAYFAIAPFIGAVAAVALGEPVTVPLVLAGGLMVLGVWLHLTERHDHVHTHEALAHSHEHAHDVHHRHTHGEPVPAATRHTHWHEHAPTTHAHAHFPDAHHDHDH